MREEHIHIPTKDAMLFARLWNTREEAKGAVVILHDSAEHSKRYANLALFFAHHGYNVISFDLRGHGYTALNATAQDWQREGRRLVPSEYPDFGFVPAAQGGQIYANDLHTVLGYIQARFTTAQVYIIAHGFTTHVLLNALSLLVNAHSGKINGIVLSSPIDATALRLAWYKRKVRRAMRVYGEAGIDRAIDRKILKNYNAQYKDLRTDLDCLSTLIEEVDRYISDPLCGQALRLGLHRTIIEEIQLSYKKTKDSTAKTAGMSGSKAGMSGGAASATRATDDELSAETLQRAQSMYAVPMLIIAGQESPIGNFGRAAQKFEKMLKKRGFAHVWQRLYSGRHAIFHDRMRDDIFADCLKWMDALQ